jgi:hypothetical protein
MEKIISKIQKLLALAHSDNEHEAAAAMARAQALMVEYAISEAQLAAKGEGKVEPIEVEAIGLYGKKVPHWEARLANYLAPVFFCSAYYTPGSDVWMVGRKSDREVFKATFLYIRGEILRLSDKAWNLKAEVFKAVIHGRTWKRGYHEGACATIKERLAVELKKLVTDNAGTAMVLANRQLAVTEFVNKNMNLRMTNSKTRVNPSGFSEGKAAGHGLNLNGRASKALGA